MTEKLFTNQKPMSCHFIQTFILAVYDNRGAEFDDFTNDSYVGDRVSYQTKMFRSFSFAITPTPIFKGCKMIISR